MKFRMFIGECHEEEVLVYAREQTELVKRIRQLCEEDAFELIGSKNRESVRLNLSEICCFAVEDNKIYALTEGDRYQLKFRLFQLEERLPESFVKINQSCIANLKMIKRFDVSISGSLMVKFKNGYIDYVSRRNLKNVKERLGL